MLAGCDLVIFDCDGVLVDSETLAVRAFSDVLQEAGLPVTPAMVERHLGMKQADVLIALSEETGRDIPFDVVERLWPATRRAFERSLQPMAGVAAFLAAMPAVGRCVASSSNPERIAVSLALTGLAEAFGSAVFSAHQVARGKPAPDLFLFAAASMGREPARCLVIEDAVSGVEAARTAGMRAIGFAGGSHIGAGHAERLAEAGAKRVVAGWDALTASLAGQ